MEEGQQVSDAVTEETLPVLGDDPQAEVLPAASTAPTDGVTTRKFQPALVLQGTAQEMAEMCDKGGPVAGSVYGLVCVGVNGEGDNRVAVFSLMTIGALTQPQPAPLHPLLNRARESARRRKQQQKKKHK